MSLDTVRRHTLESMPWDQMELTQGMDRKVQGGNWSYYRNSEGQWVVELVQADLSTDMCKLPWALSVMLDARYDAGIQHLASRARGLDKLWQSIMKGEKAL